MKVTRAYYVAILSVSAGVVGACRGQDAGPTASAPTVAAPLVSSAPAPASAPSPEGPPARLVGVTEDEARSHGRTPVGFSIDVGGTGLTATPFPSASAYLTLSGAGGGFLMVEISATGRLENEPAVERNERLVRAEFGKRHAFELGAPATVTLAGAARQAMTFTTGDAPRKEGWCAVVIPFARGGGELRVFALLVAFGLGGAGPSCDEILAHRELARVASTFTLR